MPKKEDILRENKSKKEKKNICHKKNLFQTYKYFYLDEQKKGTLEEDGHMMNIINLLNHLLIMEKWGTIQKYIGTRSCEQIRSHALKFFMRLQALKSDKCFYDFKKNNIQSLVDVINLIAKKNEKNNNNKEFIINKLIALTALNLENNGKKFFEKKKDNFRIEITEKKEDKNKI